MDVLISLTSQNQECKSDIGRNLYISFTDGSYAALSYYNNGASCHTYLQPFTAEAVIQLSFLTFDLQVNIPTLDFMTARTLMPMLQLTMAVSTLVLSFLQISLEIEGKLSTFIYLLIQERGDYFMYQVIP